MSQLFGHFSHYFFILVFVVIFIARTGMWRRGGFFARRLFARNQKSQQASAAAPLNTPIQPSNNARPEKQGETDLPQSVLNRITQEEAHPKPWTSGLSVNDWLLSKRYKMQPLRLVLGTSYFQNGFSEQFYANFYQSGEMESVEHALYTSCELAVQRLQKEAQLLGANAVVAVRMHTRIADLLSHQVECTFTGTAVTIPGLPESDHPILCTVSMPEFIKLMECGSIPVGLSMGAGVYYEKQSIMKMLRGLNYNNQEMPDCTRATYAAKHIAMTQIQADTQRLKADGCITHKSHHFVRTIRSQGNNDNNICGFAIHFIVFGTAIANGNAADMPNFKLALAVNPSQGKHYV